jgi:hypothetical protein
LSISQHIQIRKEREKFLIDHRLQSSVHKSASYNSALKAFLPAMYSKTALLSVFAAVVLPQLAQGHGYITSPAARNYSPNDGFYDDQAGNGAGSPIRFNSNPGICGDPFQGHTSTNFAGTAGPIRGEALCKST